MIQARIWPTLRAESKIYGMAVLGVICSCAGCFIAMIFLGIMWSVGGAIPGYFIGDFLSKILHDGKAQRWLNWYFPAFAKSCAPNSSIKRFF